MILKKGRETGEKPLNPPVPPALCTSVFAMGNGRKGGRFSNSLNSRACIVKGSQMIHQGLAFCPTNAGSQSVGFGLAVRKERTGSPTRRTKENIGT